VPRRIAVVVLLAGLAGCGGTGPAPQSPAGSTGQTGVRLVKVGTFSSPVYVTAPPADRSRLFVVEQAGRIRVMRAGHVLSRPFLDISGDVEAGGERGLLSMAFPPDYASSRLFYVYFTDHTGDIRIRQYRRSADASVAEPASGKDVLRVGHRAYPNHDGGQLQFGPDRMLYAGFGDGGGEGDPFRSGQRLNTLLAKLIRIDPRPGGGYRIPNGNPFAGRPGARAEIWTYGLRNPFRFSFDRSTGDLTIGDVGQDKFEEVDFRTDRARGVNFGWSAFEGFHRYRSGPAPGAVKPQLAPSHGAGFCAIIGGYVVRDPNLRSLAGRYVYGDNCNPRIYSVRLTPGGATGNHATGLRVSALSSFGEDAGGHVYAASLNGDVYRLAAK
jgi:glucose/arabinose dehydrogenase